MLNHQLLTELSRQRRRDVAREVALCQQVRSPRCIAGRALIALGGLAVVIGTALDQEPERNPQITIV